MVVCLPSVSFGKLGFSLFILEHSWRGLNDALQVFVFKNYLVPCCVESGFSQLVHLVHLNYFYSGVFIFC